MRSTRTLLFGCLLLALPAAAPASEGMWLPSQVPLLADELAKAGVKLDAKALADPAGDPLGAVVNVTANGSCSASFVSPQGLVVTNHHCITGLLQFNSTPQRDLLRSGYLAKTQHDELAGGPGARVYVPLTLSDVTREVMGTLPAKLTDLERYQEIDRREKELVKACEAPGGLRCRVTPLFGGLQYQLQSQLEIRDLRLVYAPAVGIGDFGGEVDNWVWPRHTGDFGFLRAYVGADGKPADPSPSNVPYRPKHWLRIAKGDLSPGDAVIVAGFPGSTHRLDTAAEVRDDEEFTLPLAVRYRQALIAILEEKGKGHPEVALKNANRLESLYNILKKSQGTLVSFQRARLVARREAEEKSVPAALHDAKAVAAFRDTLVAIDAQLARPRSTRARDAVLTWLAQSSPMLGEALRVHKVSLERAKANDLQRTPGYQERDWPALEGRLRRTQSAIEPGSDRAGLRFFLLEATKLPAGERLPGLDGLLAGTGGATPEAQVDALLDRLYAGTRIADLDSRVKMFHQPTAELVARHDPMIELAAALRPQLDAAELRDHEIAGAMALLRPRYEQALVAARGGRLAPDANLTLRVSFGQVTGYAPRDGVSYAAQTTIAGVLEKDTGKEPFASPPVLLAAARAGELGPYVDRDLGTLPVAFLATTDITNGSSGSPMLNARGELCGLAFDGNLDAMGSDFLVEPALTRTIAVDGRYMLWVMDRVDGAHDVLREMGVEPSFAASAKDH